MSDETITPGESDTDANSTGISSNGGLHETENRSLRSDPKQPIGGSADVESGPTVLEDAPPTAAASSGEPSLPPRGVDFTQIRYEFRCKICRLSQEHPELYLQIHEMVLKERLTYTAALQKANHYIEEKQLGVALLNIVNIGSHFRKHIGADQRVAMVIANEIEPPSFAPAPKVAKAMQRMVEEHVGDEVDDFRNLDNIRSRLTTQLDVLETQLNTVDPLTKATRLSHQAVGLYKELIGEIRNCINDLNKMRQSERLIKTVVQQLLDRMTFAIIPQLLDEYTIISEELAHHGTSLEVVRNIDERLRTKTAQIVATTARAAVVEVQRTFKLK